MDAEPGRAALRRRWRIHRLVWRVSGGRIGTRIAGLPVLELITTGRTTGEPRSVLLSYAERPHGPVVIASNAGSDRHPAWYLNLEAQPRATIRRAGRTTRVVARSLEGPERDEAWQAAVRGDPLYERYRARTSRRFPVVLLEPGGGSG